MKYFLSALFVLLGICHFWQTEVCLKLMPPGLPCPRQLIYISGSAAIVLGLLLLVSKTKRMASWGLILFLIAVFPANIHMALHPEIFPEIPAWAAWVRLPFQALLIYWVYKVGRQK